MYIYKKNLTNFRKIIYIRKITFFNKINECENYNY